jgi:Zn-dependent peptidase ImmA (M78 family)
MPKRKEIPNKARLKYAAEKAYQLLIDMGFNRFPISPFDIIKQYPKRIICLSWSEARTVLKCEDPFHLHQLSAEARTMHVRDQDLYMIVYDDVNMTNPDRILWTIMHELGHIDLGHLTDFEATALSRGGLTRTEYSVLEIEAHRFAAEVFAPAAFFRSQPYIGSKDLRLICGISEEAANKQYNYLLSLQYAPPTSYDGKLEHNFIGLVYKQYGEMLYNGIQRIWGRPGYKKYVSLSRKCPRCYAFNTIPEAKHCIYCGEILEPNHDGWSPCDIEVERKRITDRQGLIHWYFTSGVKSMITGNTQNISYSVPDA